MKLPQEPKIKTKEVLYFICPLCKQYFEVDDVSMATLLYLSHIKRDCFALPRKKICASCEYQKSGGCKLKHIDNSVAIITGCGFYNEGCPEWKLHKRLEKYEF